MSLLLLFNQGNSTPSSLPVNSYYYRRFPYRAFYFALPVRLFYIRTKPMLIPQIPNFNVKDPRETVVLTFDATLELAAGETLTGTPTVQVSLQIGIDNPPSLVLADTAINGTALNVGGNQIAIGAAVQTVASAGKFGSQYLIAITCQTSNPDKILTLKASLPMASQ
jgi:hypothetical protein